MANHTDSTMSPHPVARLTDQRSEQRYLEARAAAIRSAGDAAMAEIPGWDSEGDEPANAYLQRVATARAAAEAEVIRRLPVHTGFSEWVDEVNNAHAARAVMPAPTAAVPTTISSIVRPPVVSAPALSGGDINSR